MRFIRFVIARRHSDSGVEDGVFTLAYELRDSPELKQADRELLAENLTWFDGESGNADTFQPNEVEGVLPSENQGIAWFKDTATEHLSRMHQMKAVLEQYGHAVVMLSESRVGYVIHDDAFQVVAEPFSDTQTG